MYNITETDIEFGNLLKSKLSDFEKDYEKSVFILEATLTHISSGVNISDVLNYKSNRQVWNLACFINIVSYDLKIIAKNLAFSKREWEKRLFARQACLLIYETLNDLFDLLGKDFRKIISELKNRIKYENNLKDISKDLNLFKNTYIEKLKKIRNVSIAHRDKNTIDQLKTIYSISWTKSINMIASFDKILNNTGKLLEQITGDFKELNKLD